MTEKHKSTIADWAKEQHRIVNSLKEQHLLKALSQQKIVDDLRRANAALESDSARCKRDLQSCRATAVAREKLLADGDISHRSALEEALSRATEAEAQLEASRTPEKELASKVSALVATQTETNDAKARHAKVMAGLQTELLSSQEENQALSTRITDLREEGDRAQEACRKEKEAAHQRAQHAVREAHIEREALRTAIKSAQLRARERDTLFEKQAMVLDETRRRMMSEKEDLINKHMDAVTAEREVAASLIAKVQELASQVHALTEEKHNFQRQAKEQDARIDTLEGIIEHGEARLSRFGQQLARSHEEQERRIMREVELTKELEQMKRCRRSRPAIS